MARTADTDALVRLVVESLVDDVDAVRIERTDTDEAITYEITVAPDDVGKVIGRQGRIIKAIRTIARAAGSTDSATVEVEILG
jgi:predicted RNA-binding protein YlqC (UPF0109 family)